MSNSEILTGDVRRLQKCDTITVLHKHHVFSSDNTMLATLNVIQQRCIKSKDSSGLNERATHSNGKDSTKKADVPYFKVLWTEP